MAAKIAIPFSLLNIIGRALCIVGVSCMVKLKMHHTVGEMIMKGQKIEPYLKQVVTKLESADIQYIMVVIFILKGLC